MPVPSGSPVYSLMLLLGIAIGAVYWFRVFEDRWPPAAHLLRRPGRGLHRGQACVSAFGRLAACRSPAALAALAVGEVDHGCPARRLGRSGDRQTRDGLPRGDRRPLRPAVADPADPRPDRLPERRLLPGHRLLIRQMARGAGGDRLSGRGAGRAAGDARRGTGRSASISISTSSPTGSSASATSSCATPRSPSPASRATRSSHWPPRQRRSSHIGEGHGQGRNHSKGEMVGAARLPKAMPVCTS